VTAVVLPFEKPVVELLARVKEVRALSDGNDEYAAELKELEEQTATLVRELLAQLTPLQKVQLSRHANRPYCLDYVERLFDDWVELKGDRAYAEDAAIVAGMARYRGRSIAVVGHQKGRGTKDNVKRNFGMPHPEGYRKAIRVYELADRFGLPIVTFIDTPGAHPGIGAEERGQSQAIGTAIATMARARVPIVACIVGEGGSGGALALGVANRVVVLELGCYTVITPEGCAAILWSDRDHAAEAAKQLKITANDLLRLGVVDEVVAEPPGGAHHDHDWAARNLDQAIGRALDELGELSGDELAAHRYDRFRALGELTEG